MHLRPDDIRRWSDAETYAFLSRAVPDPRPAERSATPAAATTPRDGATAESDLDRDALRAFAAACRASLERWTFALTPEGRRTARYSDLVRMVAEVVDVDPGAAARMTTFRLEREVHARLFARAWWKLIRVARAAVLRQGDATPAEWRLPSATPDVVAFHDGRTPGRGSASPALRASRILWNVATTVRWPVGLERAFPANGLYTSMLEKFGEVAGYSGAAPEMRSDVELLIDKAPTLLALLAIPLDCPQYSSEFGVAALIVCMAHGAEVARLILADEPEERHFG
jgi:hypothetical protein